MSKHASVSPSFRHNSLSTKGENCQLLKDSHSTSKDAEPLWFPRTLRNQHTRWNLTKACGVSGVTPKTIPNIQTSILARHTEATHLPLVGTLGLITHMSNLRHLHRATLTQLTTVFSLNAFKAQYVPQRSNGTCKGSCAKLTIEKIQNVGCAWLPMTPWRRPTVSEPLKWQHCQLLIRKALHSASPTAHCA